VSTALCLGNEAPLPGAPLVRSWREPVHPLPLRAIHPAQALRTHPLQSAAPPWLASGPVEQPFDFCGHVRRLCADVVTQSEELRHIDVSRLLFAVTQARSQRSYGLQAKVTPLRFRHGNLQHCRRGVSYQVQRYFVNEREMLYVVTFCLPRFLNQSFDDKFITLFHELYHISPAFDGDLRRHEGRCTVHSHSKRLYDAQMAQFARTYLANGADPALSAFLRLNFAQLQQRHGSVVGVMVPRPKLIPVRMAE
jgi:hypothetical protein